MHPTHLPLTPTFVYHAFLFRIITHHHGPEGWGGLRRRRRQVWWVLGFAVRLSTTRCRGDDLACLSCSTRPQTVTVKRDSWRKIKLKRKCTDVTCFSIRTKRRGLRCQWRMPLRVSVTERHSPRTKQPWIRRFATLATECQWNVLIGLVRTHCQMLVSTFHTLQTTKLVISEHFS